MMRTLGTITLACVLAAGLAACGDDGPGDDQGGGAGLVDGAERLADDAIDGVIHDLAARLELSFGSGGRLFAICGESYAPGGVRMRNFLNFQPSGVPDEASAAAASEVLTADGWTIVRPGNPQIVQGEKDGLSLRVELGAGAVVVELSSDCLDTSDDVARRTQERPRAEITWKNG